MASITELRREWSENEQDYKTKEIGSGVQSFIAKVFESAALFGLKKTAAKTGQLNTFVHDTEMGKTGRPDFVLYISDDFNIPVEAKCFEHIDEGIPQLQRYQMDAAKRYNKQYGILTDGYEWRFYRASTFTKFLLPEMLENPKDFIAYWHGYIAPKNYYIEIFNQAQQQNAPICLDDPENRLFFFDDITHLLGNFKAKMKAIGTWDLFNYTDADKVATETSYAYLIQFVLYKVLVDNDYSKFKGQYDSMLRGIKEAIQNEDLYRLITSDIRSISEYISKRIYKPFAKEQASINEKLIKKLTGKPTLDEIAPWLDIIIFINKYNFANLKNEIFGFVYENYLKDLYDSEKKGQYFTDPVVVNFMLNQMGYTEKNLEKDKSRISLIDPSCGAGTFLYSAVDRIINTFSTDNSKKQAEFVESLVDTNIFGLDIEEFPLFLAEMNILMRLLPLIVNDNKENPIDQKLKIFKTRDSISEFLDTDISIKSKSNDVSLFEHLKETALDYPSFMRDEKDLQEMMESLQKKMGTRRRFDYVIGNPPYIGYNDCSQQGIPFVKKIQDKNDTSITMGDVYGVNLNTVPGVKKPYSPKPNLYAFFIALGLALLKEEGKICYIVPQTILTASDLDVLRYHLAKNTTIEKIISFGGNLFIGRGLTQKKPVPTSSLIFVIRKAIAPEKHLVKITNYEPYAEKKGVELGTYFRRGSKENKEFYQSELLTSVKNWNFIKFKDKEKRFCERYMKNTKSIEEYRCELNNYDEIQFDKGLVFDKKNINVGSNDWALIKKINGYYTIGLNGDFLDTQFIRLPRGSQGLSLFENRYKIFWRYMNFDKFYFSDNKIMIDFNWVVISSDNKTEILFLLAVLNSPLSARLFDFYLKNENEQAILVGIKSIKQYIRIPKITPINKAIKDEIIKQTEVLLGLEEITLRDIVDFSEIKVQKCDSAFVSGSNLILQCAGKEYKCKIQRGKSELVSCVLVDVYNDFGPNEKTHLSKLKTASALDVEKQLAIKSYIDDLVFALYFNVSLPNLGLLYAHNVCGACNKSEFYTIISR